MGIGTFLFFYFFINKLLDYFPNSPWLSYAPIEYLSNPEEFEAKNKYISLLCTVSVLLLLPCSRLSREYCLFTFEKGRTFLIMHKIFWLPYFLLSLPGYISRLALCFPSNWETNRVNAFNSSGDKLIVTFSTPPSTLCFFKHEMNTTQHCSLLILSIWSQCRWGQGGQADWNTQDFFLEHDSMLIRFEIIEALGCS